MNLLTDRRREEKERRRDEILDAAAAAIAEVGLDALTMDQVARQARLSRALIYVYFQDKVDLQLGLCERALELLLQRFVTEIAKEPDGRAQLAAMGRAYIGFAQEQPIYFDTLARFEASGSQALPTDGNLGSCLAIGDRVHVLMTDAIRAGIADGSIRGNVGNADAVAIVLWGFMHGVIQLVTSKGAILAQRGVDAAQLFDQARELALHSLGPDA
jgi:AcrR family transcriptional regulator